MERRIAPSVGTTTERDAEFAGVLVSMDLGFVQVQRRSAIELDFLGRRELTGAGIRVTPASETGVLERLPFISQEEWEQT